jgi:hypothetical protein
MSQAQMIAPPTTAMPVFMRTKNVATRLIQQLEDHPRDHIQGTFWQSITLENYPYQQ